MSIELGIIILNYRTPRLSSDCLDSLASEIAPGISVVVVDNDSGDGSADAIDEHIAARGYGSWARVLRSPINGGFSAGNNLGIRSMPARAYLLLNSDTLVQPGALAEFRRALKEHPDAGLIGGSFDDGDGEPWESCFTFPQPLTELLRVANTGLVNKALSRYDTPARYSIVPMEPDWMPFAGIVIRREVIDSVGLLDDGFFMYFEDVDYCIRVRNGGWKLLYWPAARITHLIGASSNVTKDSAIRERAPRYYYEARTRFFAKHFGTTGLLLANAAWFAGRAVSLARQVTMGTIPLVRKQEFKDIWVNVLHPFKSSSYFKPEAVSARLIDAARAHADGASSGSADAHSASASVPRAARKSRAH
jgi:N-acetylglucosaminyl-diphospho-decaprenol L-rhamnosyltransferase